MNKKFVLSFIFIIGNFAYANTNIIQKVNGYLRLGYQNNLKGRLDLAIGGKLHVETKKWNHLSAGLSYFSTHVLGGLNHDNNLVFFGSYNQSYDILGEVYVKADLKDTLIKIGRQELNTPYANADDIGMVPNTFGAVLIKNRSIKNITFTGLYIKNMAGIDASVPEKFTDKGMSKGVYAVGVHYRLLKNLAFQGWYYRIRDSKGDRSFTYFDSSFDNEKGNINYNAGIQFATQETLKNNPNKNAKIYGIQIGGGYKPAGVTMSLAYNKDIGASADNGFGGGPFYTSAEFLTLPDAGPDGKMYSLNTVWNVSSIGIEGISLSVGYFGLKSKNNKKSHENDISINYTYNNLSFNAIYSNVDDKINNNSFKNIAAFMNYKF